MTTQSELFDLDVLALRRARAAALGPADFLQDAVAAEVSERVREINRSFTVPAIVGPRAARWAETLTADGLTAPRLVPDGPVLDLALGGHDLVLHALALHWANDPVGQLVQCRRALRPDGMFIAALFGGETLHELRAALSAAEVAETGGLSPRVAPMGEIRELGGLMQRAGFALPVADGRRFDVSYADALALMHDLRAMGETNALRDRLRRPTPRRVVARAAAIYGERFATPDGRAPATFEVVFLTGWAPSADQPKPLRPGSARMSLADALGASEQSAGERVGK